MAAVLSTISGMPNGLPISATSDIGKTSKLVDVEKKEYEKIMANIKRLSEEIQSYVKRFDSVKEEIDTSNKKFETYKIEIETHLLKV